MELVGDDPDYKEAFLSGYFRDGQRRVDVVIATKDTSDEQVETMKMTFLMNAINMGLDVEIEAGTGDDHYDLNFIKVHAPDHILQHFGLYYNIKKFFKISHLEFINSAIWEEKEIIKIMRRWYPSKSFSNFERSQIVYKVLLSVTFGHPENFVGVNQLVDNNIFIDVFPLHDGPCTMLTGQSALELNGRQALFYNWCGYKNLFRQVPLNLVREYFGERVGFFFAFYQFYNCFLFLLAVFGLYVFGKNYYIDGRNIQLNEHNMNNTYDMEIPDFQFIITESSSTASPSDQADTLPDGDTTTTTTRKLTTALSYGTTVFAYPDLIICPKCQDLVGCPMRMMEAYKRELLCKVFLDNPLAYYMAFITVIWGILLYVLWIRKENYWYWLWETTEDDARCLTRPEYRFLPKQKKPKVVKSKLGEKILTSKVKEDEAHEWKEPKFRNIIDFFVILVAIFVVCIMYPSFMIELSNKLHNKFRYVEDAGRILYPDNSTYPDYLNLLDPKFGFQAIERFNHTVCVLVGSLNGIFIIGLETAWFRLEDKLIKKQKIRSEWLFEKKHVSNLFGMTILINVVVIGFYAFIKGAFYTFPDDNKNWNYPLQLGMLNCGLLYCTDEVFLVFTATQKTKLLYEQIMCSLTKLPRDKQHNPKDYIPPVLDRTACWEREFNLLPITEDFITILYSKLFLQIAVLMFFISVFPLAALIAFFWNLWNIKYLAKLLVVHGRRPLLVQTWGLGAWREILFIIPYIACFTNIIYLVRNNSLLDRKINNRYWSYKPNRRFFADYFMAFFNISDFKWSNEMKYYVSEYKQKFPRLFAQIHFCLFPGQFNRVITGRTLYVNTYTPMAGKWYLNWHQIILVISFSTLSIGIGVLLNIMISPVSEKVQDTKRVEEAVKQYGVDETLKTKYE